MTPSPRPVLHYAPAKNWMNDPNGLVFHRGRFHLYYQHNPLGSDHRNMSWGHASSPDLLTWQEHPVAIWFDESEQIYSGSIVVDDDRSTRFAADGGESLDDDGTEPLVAVYTSHRGLQTQSLAVSHDGGTTWQKFSGNPVLDRGSAHFRDPKVPPAARLDLRLRVEGGVELLAWLCAGDPNEGAALRVTETAVSLDRTAATAGLNEPFGSVQRVELPGRSQVVDLSVILDEGSIEVFIEGGLRTITDLAFLGVGERRLTLSASHGQVVVEHLAIADLTAPPAP